VCFSLAFSTVLQAFLTTFLIDSGYKTPIQNMDEMFASGITLVYSGLYHFLFENGDETEELNVKTNLAKCSEFGACIRMVSQYKNASILFNDLVADAKYAEGIMLGENSEPSLCRLEDGIVYNDALSMVMLKGDPVMKRVNEIIDRVFEAGIYKYWISLRMHLIKLHSRKIAIVNPLDGYYSFNLYHMQPAFYLLLTGWCLSALCFIFELLFNHVLSVRFFSR
jgi:hypothetical protein